MPGGVLYAGSGGEIRRLRRPTQRVGPTLGAGISMLAPVARSVLFRPSAVAELAQLVEQRFRKAWVIGSNPIVGSIFKPCFNRLCVLMANDLRDFEPGHFHAERPSRKK